MTWILAGVFFFVEQQLALTMLLVFVDSSDIFMRLTVLRFESYIRLRGIGTGY